MRLLLVEDDVMIGAGVRAGLRQDGYVVDWVQDASAAELALKSEPAYALVLLDLGLPGRDGFALLESLRRRGNRIPVLVITARDGVPDRVRGLDLGADDYLVKPFELDELGARIRALIRRNAGRAQPVIEYAGFRVDPTTRKVNYLGRDVSCSGREFSLLIALLDRPGQTLSRAQLEERLYGWGEEVASNAVEVHVHNLRRKLGERSIRTVRGVGYVIGEAEAPCRSGASSS